MEKLNWVPVFYNGIETNVEVTKCGKVKKVKVDWLLRRSIKDFTVHLNSYGYPFIDIQIRDIGKKPVTLHQLIAITFLNHTPSGHKLVVDHIDSNKLNNHVNNLQVITNRENLSKERTIKSGLPVGVTWHKPNKKYRARIRINGVEKFLGLFDTPEEASITYQNKLKELPIN